MKKFIISLGLLFGIIAVTAVPAHSEGKPETKTDAKSAGPNTVTTNSVTVYADGNTIAQVFNPGFTSVGVCIPTSAFWSTGYPNGFTNLLSITGTSKSCLTNVIVSFNFTIRAQAYYWNPSIQQRVLYCDVSITGYTELTTGKECPLLFPNTLVTIQSSVQGNFWPYTYWASPFSYPMYSH